MTPFALEYQINAHTNPPATLAALLSELSPHDLRWDAHPDPDRFSLRETVAHLNDWETIWRERFERVVTESSPLLTRPDLDERAAAQGYAAADGLASIAGFAERRTALVATLRALPPAAWQRTASLTGIGNVTLAELLSLAQCHDSHHVWQVALRIGNR